MPLPGPVILFDFDILLKSGHRELISAQQGRDPIAMDEHRIRLELHESPLVTTEIILDRSDIAILKVTRTEVPQDDAIVASLEAGDFARL